MIAEQVIVAMTLYELLPKCRDDDVAVRGSSLTHSLRQASHRMRTPQQRPSPCLSGFVLHRLVRSLAVFTLLLPYSLGAQLVTFRVRDDASRPLPFASVYIAGKLQGVSDSTGELRVQWSYSERVAYRVLRIPFAPYVSELARPSADTSLIVHLSLKTANRGQRISAVVTTASVHSSLARTGFFDRLQRSTRSAHSAEFITPEELAQRNPSRISDVLRGRRSISIGRGQGGAGNSLVAYGRGGCIMEIVIDGRRMTRGVGASVGYGLVDDLVGGSEVAAIEIYPSAQSTPAEISPGGSACGTVVIWTGGRQ